MNISNDVNKGESKAAPDGTALMEVFRSSVLCTTIWPRLYYWAQVVAESVLNSDSRKSACANRLTQKS